jgi:glutamate synthase (NADPH/NADH) small chain
MAWPEGHDVTVFDAHAKAGGLNEYGLASYKTADNFAQREIDWLLGIGGIRVQTGWKLAQPSSRPCAPSTTPSSWASAWAR